MEARIQLLGTSAHTKDVEYEHFEGLGVSHMPNVLLMVEVEAWRNGCAKKRTPLQIRLAVRTASIFRASTDERKEAWCIFGGTRSSLWL